MHINSPSSIIGGSNPCPVKSVSAFHKEAKEEAFSQMLSGQYQIEPKDDEGTVLIETNGYQISYS